MNIKSNKGLSMIAVIIVLAAILFAIIETVIIVKKWAEKKELEDLTTVMLLIQARSKNYSDKEIMKQTENEKNKEELVGTLIAKINDNQDLNNLIDKGIIKKDEKYYFLTIEDLEKLHVYDVKDDEIFLVNYETDEVIYLNGIEKDGEILYKLSDIKGKTEDKQEENTKQDEEKIEEVQAEEKTEVKKEEKNEVKNEEKNEEKNEVKNEEKNETTKQEETNSQEEQQILETIEEASEEL